VFRRDRIISGTSLVLMLGVVVGCGFMTPRPQKSVYLETFGGGFLYDRDAKQVQMGVVVKPRRPLPAGSILEATFEDPVGEHPYVISIVVKSDETDFTLKSPPVHGTKAGAIYHIQIKLYSDPGKSQVLDSYTQTVQAIMDQSRLGWP
jgi:hypothetical protein